MTTLGRTLPPLPGEPPHAFVSRLARLFDLSAQQFCGDMCLSFRHIIDGRGDALARVAELASCKLGDLSAYALVREGDVSRLRGQVVDKAISRRTRLHVCPACLRDDVGATSVPRDQAAYVRATWLIDSIKTCPVHARSLVPLDDGRENKGLRAHDLAARLAPFLDDLDGLIEKATPREPSALEAYLLGRIAAAGPAGYDWLDGLAFHVAARTCEMVGVVKSFGRKPSLRDLDEEEWRIAGEAGFDILTDGPSGLRAFLTELQETYDHTGPEGPQAVFGRLWQYLAFGARNPAYDPVRALVADHVVATMPLAAGAVVFDRTVEKRVVHSLQSAAEQTGCHPKRLRRLLGEAGLVPPERVGDSRITFRADLAESFLASMTKNMGLAEAGRYLNAPRVQIKLLADEGLIQPIVELRRGQMRAFARGELDRFLRDLTRDAEPDAKVGANIQDLPTAAHRANTSVVGVVRHLLDRRLAWVGTRSDVEGYMSVLVNVDEVKRVSVGAELNGLVPTDVIEELGLNWRTVNALLECGALPSHRAPHPVKGYDVTVVLRSDVEAFKGAHVTLFQLARELGSHHLRLKADLTDEGIEPSFPPEKMFSTLYRREDVTKADRRIASTGRKLGEARGRGSRRMGKRGGQTSDTTAGDPDELRVQSRTN